MAIHTLDHFFPLGQALLAVVLFIGSAHRCWSRGALLRVVQRSFVFVARRQRFAILLVGLFGFASAALGTLIAGVPAPYAQDEFSYLLAADTFARGRLTNPPHPLWVHFESMQIIQQPTYASKYPPGQGLMLALGQVITGYPIVGVWISIGLMCAAIYWMLTAWVRVRWALLGGILAILQFGFFSYWSQSYWGGAVAATGGALLYGTLPRLLREARARYAVLVGLGMAILAYTRPYEGAVVSLPALTSLSALFLGKRRLPFFAVTKQVVLPLAGVLAVTGAWLAFYNWRVTGSALRMPYMVHIATYEVHPIFLWQSPHPVKTYRHQAMRDLFIGRDLGYYTKQRTLSGFVELGIRKFKELWKFFFGDLLTLPMTALPWVIFYRRARLAVIATALIAIGMAATTCWAPHYAAPGTCLLILLLVQSIRHMRLFQWRGVPVGRYLVHSVLATCLLLPTFSYAQLHSGPPLWRWERECIARTLGNKPGKHLVIVRYGPNHNPHQEWVYNEAEIDAAKVVWAREMDKVQNQKLLNYFKDRHIWLLEADRMPPRLIPYPTSTAPHAYHPRVQAAQLTSASSEVCDERISLLYGLSTLKRSGEK